MMIHLCPHYSQRPYFPCLYIYCLLFGGVSNKKSLPLFCEIVFYFPVCDVLWWKRVLLLSVTGSQAHLLALHLDQDNNWKVSLFLADLTFTLFVLWLCEKLSDAVWRNSKRNSSCDLQGVNPNHFTILLRDNTQLNLFLSTGFSSLSSISC